MNSDFRDRISVAVWGVVITLAASALISLPGRGASLALGPARVTLPIAAANLLPLLLALLAWLWMRSQRFGSLLPSPREERRSLLEHVRASGEHLHRYGKTPLLYAAARQAFLTRLRRRAPVAAALEGEAQARAIADHLRLSPEQVRTALQVPASRDDAALRDRIALLIRMRNQL